MKGSRQGRGLLAFYLTRDPFLLDKCTLRKYLIHVCRINLCNGWCRPGVQCIHILRDWYSYLRNHVFLRKNFMAR